MWSRLVGSRVGPATSIDVNMGIIIIEDAATLTIDSISAAIPDPGVKTLVGTVWLTYLWSKTPEGGSAETSVPISSPIGLARTVVVVASARSDRKV